MSDVTPENKQRSFLMTVFDALLGLGITCSQIITGYMIELTSFTYSFLITECYVCIICKHVCNFKNYNCDNEKLYPLQSHTNQYAQTVQQNGGPSWYNVLLLTNNLYLFVIAVMVNGLSGTFYTFSFNNYTLMSDVTPENKQRSFYPHLIQHYRCAWKHFRFCC
jgi:predicted MFS family arabinose efflux permease